jgi:flavin reductase (DIM6/NTAB) family NADH-FMN oxidoreductase RutF
MFIVTAVDGDGERAGCLVGFATQCSIDPPRFLTCISRANRTFEVATRAEIVVVHFLGRAQIALAELFGSQTGDEVDKFQLCEWQPGPGGAPVLSGVPGWFAGRVLARHDLGDHVGLWLEPVEAHDNGGPLDVGYQAVKGVDPGHPAH